MNRFILIAFLGLGCQMLFGQAAPSLPDQCQVFRPAVLGKPGQKVSLLKEKDARTVMSAPFGQNGKQTKTYWTVYSDRDDNVTYYTSSGNAVFKTLYLGQAVTIARIENGRALVYLDKKSDREYPSMPIEPVEGKCYGWVPMNHLLLWDSCPTDDSGIYNKALLCVNIDAKKGAQSVKDAEFKYTSPEKGSPLPLVLDEKIYYIMKRSGDYTLLATQYTMGSASTSGVLVGWVKDISFIPWNQRVCFEPTWDTDNVEYFMNKAISANIVEKKGSSPAASWDFKAIAPDVKKKNDKKYRGGAPEPYRLPGDFRRFPVLGKEGDWIHVSSFSRSSTKTGSFLSPTLEKSEQEIRQLQNINLVLLIDGTQSMAPFYPAVRQGLLDGCNSLAGIKNAKIKVSAIIYRNQADTRGGTSYEIEPYPSKWVDPSDSGLNEFLTRGGEYGIRSKGKSMEESLYEGLETALSYFNGREKQSNILLVVGDCGNLNDDATREEIIKTASNRYVQIISYQVHQGDHKSYTAFAEQLSLIMSESLKRIYASLEKAGKKQLSGNLLRFRQDGNRFSLARVDENSIYRGLVICPFDRKKMSENELKNEMFSSIYSLSEAIQQQINIIVSNSSGNASDGKVSMEIVNDFLALRGIDKRDLGNNDVSFMGWTKNPSDRPYWKPVLLLSSDELTTLVNELNLVNTKAHAESEDRKPFIDAMVELASKHAGGLSGQDIRTLSANEIQEMIYGLPEKSGMLSNRTLEELADPIKVSNAEFRRILNEFRMRFNKLKNIRSRSDYQGRYDFNGAQYYWIPTEDLP